MDGSFRHCYLVGAVRQMASGPRGRAGPPLRPPGAGAVAVPLPEARPPQPGRPGPPEPVGPPWPWPRGTAGCCGVQHQNTAFGRCQKPSGSATADHRPKALTSSLERAFGLVPEESMKTRPPTKGIHGQPPKAKCILGFQSGKPRTIFSQTPSFFGLASCMPHVPRMPHMCHICHMCHACHM